MINPNSGPMLPADKLPIIPSEAQLAAASAEQGGGDLSDSPWAKMFPGGATKEELQQFVQMYIRSIVTQMKHDEKVHKENLDKQKIAMERGY
jgi:hypothetical protein